jgi:hypothetical protein
VGQEQRDRFGEAVERKKRASKRASEQAGQGGDAGSPVTGDQQDLISPARPQDTTDERKKNTGHRKKTADKWNQ